MPKVQMICVCDIKKIVFNLKENLFEILILQIVSRERDQEIAFQ